MSSRDSFMVYLRLNEKEPNPNGFINLITALPMPDAQDSERARQLLRALAAQVRPVMKAHGFTVNSLEEYEYNSVFSGRNWNNGETIEIVLRRSNGSYCPTSWLMSTFCHELAHIKVMTIPRSDGTGDGSPLVHEPWSCIPSIMGTSS
ncbi:hypothetical protein Ac2012v2_002429 [Leucoagaricus gongylophorus]